MDRRLAAVLAALVALLAAASPAAAQRAGKADIGAYRGLGTWVDIYDGGPFANPPAAVGAMRARGVRTLFLETSNDRQAVDIVKPAQIASFIESAHAAGMKAVGWYLPDFRRPAVDVRRSLAAIRFRTPTGQSFDSFGLDIELTKVRPAAVRTRRMLNVSKRIRRGAGSTYPLSAITPSPVGMSLSPSYWPRFPWAALLRFYDVIAPMGYATYHTSGAAGTYSETQRNIAMVRAATRNPGAPIHLVGGLAGKSDGPETAAFVRAVREGSITGTSLYDFATTGGEDWASLTPVGLAGR